MPSFSYLLVVLSIHIKIFVLSLFINKIKYIFLNFILSFSQRLYLIVVFYDLLFLFFIYCFIPLDLLLITFSCWCKIELEVSLTQFKWKRWFRNRSCFPKCSRT